MSELAISLSTYYVDARDAILSAMNTERAKVLIGTYNSDTYTVGELTDIHIPESQDDTDFANMSLNISYHLRTFGKEGAVTIPVTKELEILCNAGDIGWTKRTKDFIFDGEVPTSVVVDPNSHEVFLLYVKMGSLKLQKFGTVSEEEMDSMKNDIHERDPYRLKLEYDALFMFFDGAYGVDQLKESLYIEFNCGVPIRVDNTAVSPSGIEGV